MHQLKQIIFIIISTSLIMLSGCATANYNYFPQKMDDDASISAWTNEAVTDINTYNFTNYKKHLQFASNYFTPEGWKTYMATLNASGNLNDVVQQKLIATAVTAGSVTILQKGNNAWTVQMPMLVTYENTAATVKNKQRTVVTMYITKSTPRNVGVKGYVINRYASQ